MSQTRMFRNLFSSLHCNRSWKFRDSMDALSEPPPRHRSESPPEEGMIRYDLDRELAEIEQRCREIELEIKSIGLAVEKIQVLLDVHAA